MFLHSVHYCNEDIAESVATNIAVMNQLGSSNSSSASCSFEVSFTCSVPCGDHFSQAEMNLFRKILSTPSSTGVVIELMNERALFLFASTLVTEPILAMTTP